MKRLRIFKTFQAHIENDSSISNLYVVFFYDNFDYAHIGTEALNTILNGTIKNEIYFVLFLIKIAD